MGNNKFCPNQYWSSIHLKHQLVLSVHADLSVETISNDKITITILGIAIDPFKPHSSEEDILKRIISDSTDINSLIQNVKPLSGRWVIIFQDSDNTFLFTDPAGFRQIYYFRNGETFYCGSQPEIIARNCTMNFSEEVDLISFIKSEKFKSKESAWIGKKTIYKKCFHLLPNHFLQLTPFNVVRFYPDGRKGSRTVEEICNLSCKILKGTITAIQNRYKSIQAITAGWDSRVLLAASKQHKDNIQYYMDRQGRLPLRHPDVAIPLKMSKDLDFQFSIENSSNMIQDWFVKILFMNVTNARILPKTVSIFSRLSKKESIVRINGDGGGMGKQSYRKKDGNVFSSRTLAKMIGYEGISFVENELEEWLSDLDKELLGNTMLKELLYWEQRLGNWGALMPAERDIAIEELSPFNSRLLIELIISAPEKMKSSPDCRLHALLIKEMWPELLSYPVNPEYDLFRKSIKRIIKKVLPKSYLMKIKEFKNI